MSKWRPLESISHPVSTMRLENFRDGLEDYAYAKLCRERFGANVDVPDEVAKSLGDFTHDPKVLQAWRDRMAERGRAANLLHLVITDTRADELIVVSYLLKCHGAHG